MGAARVLSAVLLAGLLTACAGIEIKPGEVSHARREIPPGPGVFSGSDGQFTIYSEAESTGAADEQGGSGGPAAP